MADRSLRGTRIGAHSMESEEGVEFAERFEAYYDCPNGHTVVLPFAAQAALLWPAFAAGSHHTASGSATGPASALARWKNTGLLPSPLSTSFEAGLFEIPPISMMLNAKARTSPSSALTQTIMAMAARNAARTRIAP